MTVALAAYCVAGSTLAVIPCFAYFLTKILTATRDQTARADAQRRSLDYNTHQIQRLTDGLIAAGITPTCDCAAPDTDTERPSG